MRRTIPNFRLMASLALSFFCLAVSSALAEQNKVVLQLRWEPQYQFAGYYVALHKGYYRDLNLDVEIRHGVQPGPKYLSAAKEVSEGRATFGIGSTDVALARANGARLSIVSSLFQHSPIRIFTRRDHGVTNLSDVVNLRFSRGIQKNGPAEIELRALLRDQGYNLYDLNVSEVRKRSFQAFLEGEVDVHPGFSLSTPFVARPYDVELSTISPSEYGIRFYGDSLFAKEEFIRAQPNLVSRFVKASLRGWKDALENPQAAIDLLMANYQRVTKVGDFREFNEFQVDEVRKLIDWPTVALGNTSHDRWRNVADHMGQLGLIKNDARMKALVLDPRELEIASFDEFSFWMLTALASTIGVVVVVIGFAVLLKREVKNRTEEFRAAMLRAEEADKAKSNFLAVMSHELRTPLNAVIGFSDLLSSTSARNLTPEKVTNYAENIGTSGRTLLHLINDILEFAKIDASKFEFSNQPFRLADELANIGSIFEAKARENNVALTTDLPNLEQVVNGDAFRLRQIAFNLIDNAIKFSANGNVKVSARTTPLPEDQLELALMVDDDGIGVAEDRIDAIFEPFSQAQNTISREYGGTGLGLAISRSLAREMGGDVTVVSELGKGSRFEVRLVLQDLTKFRATLADTQDTQDSQHEIDLGLTVLAVDDVETNLNAVESLLADFGCKTEKARNGKEAVDWLIDNPVDAVLMDIHMPGMDGISAAKKIIDNGPNNDGVPIYAWTADVTSRPDLEASGVPWAGVILKPTARDALLTALRSMPGSIPA